MCEFKSGIVLKGRVFVPDYDHHTQMLEELDIEDSWVNAKSKFVRFELVPPEKDMFMPVEDWIFIVDQDIVPDWFDKDNDRDRVIVAVKKWADAHIFINKNDFSISNGTYYLKNCKNVTCDDSTVMACDGSTVTACNGSTVTAWDDSTVTAWDDSTVTAWEHSTVTARDNSTVTACDGSTVTAWDDSIISIPNYSSNVTENVILMGNSTLKNCKEKTLYQSGDWKLVIVNNE